MLKLLKIEFFKLRYSKTFWIICGLYAFLVILIPFSVSTFLDWVKIEGGDLNGFDPTKIPVLYFPDIWQNMTFVYGYTRIFLGILVVISVSNEYTYRTVRQNVIDGLSRKDFIVSKLVAFFVISLAAALLVFVTLFIAGAIHSPEIRLDHVVNGLQFIGGYFLNIFAYMALALLLTVVIQRTGLTIAIILLITGIEYIIGLNLPDSVQGIVPYLPMHSLENLVTVPFQRYLFKEIQDYVSITSVLVVIGYLGLFIYGTYAKLKSSDL